MSNAYAKISVVIIAIIAAAAVAPTANMQIALGQQTPFDALAMRVHLTPDPNMGNQGWYRINGWSMRITNGSALCPSGGCLFSLETPAFFPFGGGAYMFTGTLKITVMTSGVVHSWFYTMGAQLTKLGSKEMLGQRTEALGGTVRFVQGMTQSGTQSPTLPELEYNVVNGTLQVDPYTGAPVLTLQGVKS